MPDIRDSIFHSIASKQVQAVITSDETGVLVETSEARKAALSLDISVDFLLPEASLVNKGDVIARISGKPNAIAQAEERLIGLMAKPSGIASAARRFVDAAGGRPRIVSGAWKKMPPSQKDSIRRAISAGGAEIRISRKPFIYMDKNYIRMLGGIKPSLEAVAHLEGYLWLIQINNGSTDIAADIAQAADYGANIIFIDTGRPADAALSVGILNKLGLRQNIQVAFGGGITLKDIESLKTLDLDLLDIGRAIVDAPLLDMKLDVV